MKEWKVEKEEKDNMVKTVSEWMGGRREENKYQFINEQINNVQKENERVR